MVIPLAVITFLIGYVFIAFEFKTQINRATIALLMGVACWTFQFFDETYPLHLDQLFLAEKVYEMCQVFFFLLAALTIVELIAAHDGFKLITEWVKVKSKRKFLFLLSMVTFALSSVVDNLTTTLIMISILRHLIHENYERQLFGGMVVIAANAGGAWTPIGDVTTTMLWIGGQVNPLGLMQSLLLPSLACVFAAMIPFFMMLSGDLKDKELQEHEKQVKPVGTLVFYLGIGSLIFVPIFSEITHLPPFMGALFGLGILWLVTDIAHRAKDGRDHLRVTHALSRVDLSGVLFFLGILLAIDALEVAGVLSSLEQHLEHSLGHPNLIIVIMGFFSSVIDNIPLVAICMGMYSTVEFPINSELWQLVAYCGGTGGSMLIIGSAGGIALMAMEKVTFKWFLKNISGAACLGYCVGLAVYLFQQSIS